MGVTNKMLLEHMLLPSTVGHEVPVLWESCPHGTDVQVHAWMSHPRTRCPEERNKGPRQKIKGSGVHFSTGSQ